jgi:hypothetical protein
MREFDAIDEGREERQSAVEKLASLVYGLIVAYLWFWILIAALGFVILAVKHV